MHIRTRIFFLQFALGCVLLWSGIDRVVQPGYWIDLIPPTVSSFLSVNADYVMYFLGLIYIGIGIWILLPIRTYIAGMAAFFIMLLGMLLSGSMFANVYQVGVLLACIALVAMTVPTKLKIEYDF